jgi:hypothetical protein
MSTHKDQIRGGLADRRSEEDFSEKKLEAGKKVEREHTSNKEIAEEIAMDHLTEDPKYYTKLKKIEKMAYAQGRRDALAKFGSASASPPANDGASAYRDSGSPVATTSFKGMSRAVDQGWLANADRGFTSTFTDPGFRNHTLHGGPPSGGFVTDTTGGQRDS